MAVIDEPANGYTDLDRFLSAAATVLNTTVPWARYTIPYEGPPVGLKVVTCGFQVLHFLIAFHDTADAWQFDGERPTVRRRPSPVRNGAPSLTPSVKAAMIMDQRRKNTLLERAKQLYRMSGKKNK
jgi:hypothetical protein